MWKNKIKKQIETMKDFMVSFAFRKILYKMPILKKLFIYLSFFLLSSCYISFGTTSEYRHINSNYPNLLKHLKNTDSICNIQYSDATKVIVTDAITLKKCLKNSSNTVVFIWKPDCMKNSSIYSLDSLQDFFTNKGFDFYVIARNYSGLMKRKYNIIHPIIGIDTKFYKSNLVKKYLGKFLYELSNTQYKDDGRPLIYMENGNYIGKYRLTETMEMDSTILVP